MGGWVETYPIFVWIFGICLTLQGTYHGKVLFEAHGLILLMQSVICLQETTVSEKVTAYLQDLSLFASAGGIVNTQRKCPIILKFHLLNILTLS